jgi:hypothetical protein
MVTAMTPINSTYIDNPGVTEIFADSVRMITFNESILRLELCVTRVDEPHPPKPPTGRIYPAARLALTSSAALHLHEQLTRLVSVLEKQGIVQRHQASPSGPQH